MVPRRCTLIRGGYFFRFAPPPHFFSWDNTLLYNIDSGLLQPPLPRVGMEINPNPNLGNLRVSYQSWFQRTDVSQVCSRYLGHDVRRGDNALTIRKACNNTSTLPYTLQQEPASTTAHCRTHYKRSCCTLSRVSVVEGNSKCVRYWSVLQQ